MNKKYLIIGLILIIGVAVVAFFMMQSKKQQTPVTTTTTERTGLSSVLNNVDMKSLSQILLTGALA